MDSKGSKKRKLSHLDCHIDINDDADEEQKIDQFYALIRSMREARDRLMNVSSGEQAIILNKDDNQTLQIKERKKLHDQEKGPLVNGSAAWKPSFESEDFTENNNNSGVDDVGEVLKFKVPNFHTFGTNNSSSSDKIVSRAAAVLPDQNQVQTTIIAKEPLDLTLSL